MRSWPLRFPDQPNTRQRPLREPPSIHLGPFHFGEFAENMVRTTLASPAEPPLRSAVAGPLRNAGGRRCSSALFARRRNRISNPNPTDWQIDVVANDEHVLKFQLIKTGGRLHAASAGIHICLRSQQQYPCRSDQDFCCLRFKFAVSAGTRQNGGQVPPRHRIRCCAAFPHTFDRDFPVRPQVSLQIEFSRVTANRCRTTAKQVLSLILAVLFFGFTSDQFRFDGPPPAIPSSISSSDIGSIHADDQCRGIIQDGRPCWKFQVADMQGITDLHFRDPYINVVGNLVHQTLDVHRPMGLIEHAPRNHAFGRAPSFPSRFPQRLVSWDRGVAGRNAERIGKKCPIALHGKSPWRFRRRPRHPRPLSRRKSAGAELLPSYSAPPFLFPSHTNCQVRVRWCATCVSPKSPVFHERQL